MSYAAVWIPEFPVVAWLRKDASARLQPVAVLDGVPPLEKVVSCNSAARAIGLAPGMSRVQAETLIDTKDPVRMRARSEAEEQRAFARVLVIAGRFTPRVQAVAGPANGYAGHAGLHVLLLLEQGGTELLFGSAQQYAHQLHAVLQEEGFLCQVATAPNAEASMMLARSCPGITCAGGEDLGTRLAALPLSCLPCDNEMLRVFARWGIRTLGELAHLPEKALVSRIGQQGRRLQRLARGEAEHLMVPEESALQLHEYLEVETPVELLDSLLFVLAPMLDRVLAKARDHLLALRNVTLVMALNKTAPHRLTVQPAVPTQSREQWLKLLCLQLQAHPPGAAVCALTLTAEPAQTPVAQRGLFQTQFPEPDRLDLLLARLRSIAGKECVGAPVLENSHREDAFRIERFHPCSEQENPRHRLRGPAATNPPQGKCSHPAVALRRCSPPKPAMVAVERNGAPCTVRWRGLLRHIVAVAGPWQSSGAWWDSRSWQFEEWDAVTDAPTQAMRLRWVPRENSWYVAGVYD